MRLLGFAISSAIAVQLAPSSVAAQTLAAIGPWTLTSDAESCAVQREFGEDEDTAELELRRFFRGDMRAVLSSSKLRPTQSMQIRYRVNDEEWRSDATKYNVASSTGQGSVVFFPWAFLLPEAHRILDPVRLSEFFQRPDLPALEKAAAAEVDTLTLQDAFEQPISLELGSLAEPMELIDDCFDNVVAGWNIDAEADKTLSRRAELVESTSNWIDTFPPISEIFHQTRPNDLTIRLMISASGEIEGCNFYNVGGDPRAAELSCESLRRNVRFEPALDKDGSAIRSYYVYRYINPNERISAG